MIPRVLRLFFSRRFGGLDFKMELFTGCEGLRIISSFSFYATGPVETGKTLAEIYIQSGIILLVLVVSTVVPM
jgi:hypothetical protein